MDDHDPHGGVPRHAVPDGSRLDAPDGERTRDPREQHELERLTGAPTTGRRPDDGDQAAGDDVPLPRERGDAR